MTVIRAAVPVLPDEAVPPCGVDVVAIGASAGGVTALTTVLSALPRGFPAAVIILLHVAAHYRSYLSIVLARVCRLPVREAQTGATLEPGIVYVAPSGTHLVVRGAVFLHTDAAPVHFVRPSVDVLFRSVAAACGSHAVGVILSGAGVDGADGVREIKRGGGRVIVQDPTTAEHSGMPTAAHATGCADFTVPLGEIGALLAALVPTARVATTEPRDG